MFDRLLCKANFGKKLKKNIQYQENKIDKINNIQIKFCEITNIQWQNNN